MLITSANLDNLRVGFNTAFVAGLGQGQSAYGRIATTIPSTAKENIYPFLKDMPGMREWIGPRVVHGRGEGDYRIANKDFEDTYSLPRNAIEDDTFGVYSTHATALGKAAAQMPDRLVFSALKGGFSTECADGQYFFDTDHPVIGADGSVTTVANTDGGTGEPWFLLCTTMPLKPVIFQERRKPAFVALDDPRNPNVFMNKEFIYGADARWGVGYAHWQLAWGSKQPLDKARFADAMARMQSLKRDGGVPIGLKPDLLVVPPVLQAAGLEILNAERDTAGATNVWKGTAELMVTSWLA